MGTDREEMLRARLAAAAKSLRELKDDWGAEFRGVGDERLLAEINDAIDEAERVLAKANERLAQHLASTKQSID